MGAVAARGDFIEVEGRGRCFASIDEPRAVGSVAVKRAPHSVCMRGTRGRAATSPRVRGVSQSYARRSLCSGECGNAIRLFRPLGGQIREIANLFPDIAGFTALARSLDTSKVAALFSSYLEAITEIAFAHGISLCSKLAHPMARTNFPVLAPWRTIVDRAQRIGGLLGFHRSTKCSARRIGGRNR